jgi:hypothetical protein
MADQRIAEEYRGVRFRQLAPKLRWPVGDGFANQTESVRPRNKNTLRFEDPEGTFVVFEDDARIDIPHLIRIGALVIDTPAPKAARAPAVPPAVPAATEGGGPTG